MLETTPAYVPVALLALQVLQIIVVEWIRRPQRVTPPEVLNRRTETVTPDPDKSNH